MTDRLAEIKERLAKIGPHSMATLAHEFFAKDDDAFIASAPADIAWLVAEVEEVEELKNEVEYWRGIANFIPMRGQ